MQRVQHQIVDIEADTLDDAISVVDSIDFNIPEDDWDTLSGSWTYLVPLNLHGDYDENGWWEEVSP